MVKLSIEELKAAYPNIRSLEGNSIYVKASVLTTTGKSIDMWSVNVTCIHHTASVNEVK